MKLSDRTLEVLKNFSTINTGMMFRKGNLLRVISAQNAVVGKATIPDAIVDEFCIYDLNRFLSVVGSLDEPDISIKKTSDGSAGSAVIQSGTSKLVYRLTDESMIVAAPDKDIKVPHAEVQFTLKKDALVQVLKLAGILGLPHIAIVGDKSKITLAAVDAKNIGSDTFSQDVGETTADFRFTFGVGNIKFIPSDYAVSASSKGIAHFVSPTLEYWIAMEPGSRYEA